MRRSSRLYLIGLIALFLTACAMQGSVAPPNSTASQVGTHLVVAVQGDVRVHREGWQNPDASTPVVFGTTLRHGDMLQHVNGAQSTIVCADLSLAVASQVLANVPCMVSTSLLRYNISGVNPIVNTGNEPQILLSPRKTMLLNPRPTLRWVAIEDATSYLVRIEWGGQDIWRADIDPQTSMVYPEDAIELKPGRAYRAVVSANETTSSAESDDVAFMLLDEDIAAAVRDQAAHIRTLGLDDMATRLLIAHLYAGYGLYAEAIEQLSGLPEEAIVREPVVARLLGKLYVTTGLNDLGAVRYQQALDASQPIGDYEGIAQAHHALGKIDMATGRPEQAAEHFAEALMVYEQLGNVAMVTEIQAEME